MVLAHCDAECARRKMVDKSSRLKRALPPQLAETADDDAFRTSTYGPGHTTFFSEKNRRKERGNSLAVCVTLISEGVAKGPSTIPRRKSVKIAHHACAYHKSPSSVDNSGGSNPPGGSTTRESHFPLPDSLEDNNEMLPRECVRTIDLNLKIWEKNIHQKVWQRQ